MAPYLGRARRLKTNRKHRISLKARIGEETIRRRIRMMNLHCKRLGLAVLIAIGIIAAGESRPAKAIRQTDVQIPSSAMKFGAFVAKFDPVGTFTLEGTGWPRMAGNWKTKGDEIEMSMTGAPKGCDGPARYRVRVDGNHVSFALVSDECTV